MWLYLPPEFCLSSAATEGSRLPSPEPSEAVLWVTSSGKPSQRLLSWPGWKTRPWLRLLSGTTLPPSTAARGAASWIASLAAVPAKATPSPANGWASKTLEAPSGQSNSASLTRQGLLSFSGKTSGEQFAPRSTWCRKTLKATATELRHALSALRMSGRHTSEIDSSSWPTPSGTPYGNNQSPSPGAAVRPSLDSMAARWPTPRSGDGDKAGPNSRDGSGSLHLPSMAVRNLWPTATATDAKASVAVGYSTDSGRHSGTTLTDAMRQWATPAARDSKGANSKEHLAKARGHHDQLPNQVAMLDQRFPHHPEAPTGRMLKPALNPRFVEWLMGLPFGWTQPTESIASDFSGMESSRNKQPQRRSSAGGDSLESFRE